MAWFWLQEPLWLALVGVPTVAVLLHFEIRQRRGQARGKRKHPRPAKDEG